MTTEDKTHRVFLNKPEELLEHLHCHIEIQSRRGEVVSGALVAIDPVSDTAVLVNMTEIPCSDNIDDSEMILVPFVDWDTLKVLDDSENTKNRIRNMFKDELGQMNNSNKDEILTRRNLVSKSLSSHGLSPSLDGDNLVIADTVIISPPYTDQTCDATNEIILARVKSLLKDI